MDATKLYGWAMSESVLYEENKFDKNVILEYLINTPDDLDIGYFIEADLSFQDNIEKN